MYVCVCVYIYIHIYIYDVLTPTSLSWGMGHMEQGHCQLFCIATVLQLTSVMVI